MRDAAQDREEDHRGYHHLQGVEEHGLDRREQIVVQSQSPGLGQHLTQQQPQQDGGDQRRHRPVEQLLLRLLHRDEDDVAPVAVLVAQLVPEGVEQQVPDGGLGLAVALVHLHVHAEIHIFFKFKFRAGHRQLQGEAAHPADHGQLGGGLRRGVLEQLDHGLLRHENGPIGLLGADALFLQRLGEKGDPLRDGFIPGRDAEYFHIVSLFLLFYSNAALSYPLRVRLSTACEYFGH